MTNRERTREALRSEIRNVVVTAPAGCGKTFEACRYACEAAAQLSSDQRVLFLAHTNAAVQEFVMRTRRESQRVHAATIDSFCLDVLIPYASRLGLPAPLQHHVGHGQDSVSFRSLSSHVAQLFRRSPSIARLYADQYPVVILDEHQDASPNQHEVVELIAAAGKVRVRAFGDPMQAIYGDEDEPAVDWPSVEQGADTITELDEPQRWAEAKELGEWILAARNRLRLNRTLPPPSGGTAVIFHSLDMSDPGFRTAASKELSRLIHKLLGECDGSLAVLGRYNQQVLQLQVLSGGRLTLNEGVEFEDAYATLVKLQQAEGNSAALARAIVAAFNRPSCGLTKDRLTGIKQVLGKKQLANPNRKEVKLFVEQLRPVYDKPDLSTACEVIDAIARHPPKWLRIRHPNCFRVLGSIRPGESSDPSDCLREAIVCQKRTMRRQIRCASTIHKSKGIEFDHVVLANLGAQHFPDDGNSRRLAYVALSRARRSIHIVVPAQTPSPLLC